jgi:hypothetical protein
MRRGLLWLIVCGGIGLAGCSGGDKPQPTTQNQPAAGSPAEATAAEPFPSDGPGVNALEAAKLPSVQVQATAPPEHVVQTFLDAMKTGDIATKASLLTQKAREETARENFEVNPQSAASAQYEVRPAEYLPENPNGAHVTSVWTETYPDGTIKYDVVWVLRRQAEGWRIAGMAIEFVPGQPPAFLNFEDAADMAKKYSDAMAATEPPAAEVASQPNGIQPSGAQPIESPNDPMPTAAKRTIER